MRHTTLFMKVGRSDPKPLCTVQESGHQAASVLDVQESRHLAEQIASGVDASRVSFYHETTDVPEPEKAKLIPVERTKTRRGK